jgi:thiol-disulfide isomerase/thioredoxin
MKHLSILLLVASLTALNLDAAAVVIGDPAPALKISKWVKGDDVTNLDSNKTYVVEFWATWCGPCKESIPHLTQMAHEFTNITFIGVDISENGDHKVALVSEFVKKMGDKMDYHVGMDTEDKFMADNWMKAAGQNGIPTAFLIQQGEIYWIGHPMELEKPLTEVAAGTFDIKKAKQSALVMEKIKAFFAKAMNGASDAELAPEGAEIEALDKELGGIKPNEPFNSQEVIKQARFQAALQTYQKAIVAGTNNAEIGKLETSARALAPKDANFDTIKQQIFEHADLVKAIALFAKYKAAVGENGDPTQAPQLAWQILSLNLKNAQALNEMAWAIVTDENIKRRDLGFAIALAKEGVDVSDSKEPGILDTYARALFDSGRVADAIDTQKKAIAAAPDEAMKNDLRETLEKYQVSADKAK